MLRAFLPDVFLLRQKKKPIPNKPRTPTITPIAIPAFAPPLRLDEEVLMVFVGEDSCVTAEPAGSVVDELADVVDADDVVVVDADVEVDDEEDVEDVELAVELVVEVAAEVPHVTGFWVVL